MKGALWAIAFALAAAACSSGKGSDEAAASDSAIAGCDPASDAAPDDLRCTGLYADVATKTLSPRARTFAPAKAFWSDGADKTRWIDLPDGAVIDASALDDWTFPVGTKVWKEIRVHGRRIETRFWWKTRADRWLSGAYEWAPDESSARRVDGDDLVVDGAPYHIPKASECNDCHAGRRDKLLGFEAISLGLPGASGLTLDALAAEQRLAPAPAETSFAIADDGTGHAAAAFGWLHVNCGVTCHNGNTTAKAYATHLRLRLATADLARAPDASWDMIATTVGVDAFSPAWAGATRVTPGDPDASLLLRLPRERGKEQMPPIASTVVDAEGTAAVEAWIRALAPAKAHEPPPLTPAMHALPR